VYAYISKTMKNLALSNLPVGLGSSLEQAVPIILKACALGTTQTDTILGQ
jgi:hypothetical protein